MKAMNKLSKLAAFIAAALFLSGCGVGEWLEEDVFRPFEFRYPQYGAREVLYGLAMLIFFIPAAEILITRFKFKNTVINGALALGAVPVAFVAVWVLRSWADASLGIMAGVGGSVFLVWLLARTGYGMRLSRHIPLISDTASSLTQSAFPGWVACGNPACNQPNPPDAIRCQWCRSPRSVPSVSPSTTSPTTPASASASASAEASGGRTPTTTPAPAPTFASRGHDGVWDL